MFDIMLDLLRDFIGWCIEKLDRPKAETKVETKKRKHRLIDDMRVRARYARSQGRDVILVSVDEYVEVIEADQFVYVPTLAAGMDSYPMFDGCRVVIGEID